MTEELQRLISYITGRRPLGTGADDSRFVHRADDTAPQMYANRHERLGIEFTVQRLSFPGLQTMDPRIVRIAPGKCNERHRHAHESIFVVLEGEGRVLVGDAWTEIHAGDVAFIPRWIVHQTHNTDAKRELVVLAITAFLRTSAVLGNYGRRTRLKEAGEDALEGRVS